ncbi:MULTISPECIES: hypothetical protein [Pseudoalteromonas]|uniref:Porin n=1 Tax=Pseudoalteromonas amylolytica TaxID=1859457 RepID=A0A1S1MW10_9GAMM|nr:MULTISPECIES: hypothetical protein [Pseudoalteromonas]MCF6434804.1 hypothetical protein [Pseudoalteromonas sp. MMG022]OHU87667.1 hypothetical protein BFC16_09495 [Pseudoalteromonas sp. JW3]OHU91109.1 hypothetical protein BET10_09610 [Pseudoalteromonas amylolytica]
MLKRALVLSLLASPAALASNPFTSNNFTNEAMARGADAEQSQSSLTARALQDLNDSKLQNLINSCQDNPKDTSTPKCPALLTAIKKELDIPHNKLLSVLKACDEKGYYLDDEDNKVDCPVVPSDDFKAFQWVSWDIEADKNNAFYQTALAPVGDSKNFSVGLYKGLWYLWGEDIRLPFYFSYAEPKSNTPKNEASDTLIDKDAGLQVSIPVIAAFKSGPGGLDKKQSTISAGGIFSLVAKDVKGNEDSEWVTGYRASLIAQYNSYLEVFSVSDPNGIAQPGSLNIALNYTHHKYSNDKLKNVANNLTLLNGDKYSDSFNSRGITITAEIGKVVSISYQYEEVDDAIFGNDKIKRLVLSKTF